MDYGYDYDIPSIDNELVDKELSRMSYSDPCLQQSFYDNPLLNDNITIGEQLIENQEIMNSNLILIDKKVNRLYTAIKGIETIIQEIRNSL
jgi:hypothetical protein